MRVLNAQEITAVSGAYYGYDTYYYYPADYYYYYPTYPTYYGYNTYYYDSYPSYYAYDYLAAGLLLGAAAGYALI